MNDSWDFHVLVRKKKLNRRDASVGNKLKMGKNSKRYQSSQVCNYNIILNKLATLLQSLTKLKKFSSTRANNRHCSSWCGINKYILLFN